MSAFSSIARITAVAALLLLALTASLPQHAELALASEGEPYRIGVIAQSGKYDMANAKVSRIKNQVYAGKALRPKPKVSYKGRALKLGKDYTLSYENNRKIGIATVKVVGRGAYHGLKVVKFKIKQPAYKPKFRYELFFIRGECNKLYTGNTKLVYVKTKNPDPSTIAIKDAKSGKLLGVSIDDSRYDIKGKLVNTRAAERVYKVADGYVFELHYSEEPLTNDEDQIDAGYAGKHTWQVLESKRSLKLWWSHSDNAPHRGAFDDDRGAVSNPANVSGVAIAYKVNVIDYGKAYSRWIDNVIEKAIGARDNNLTPLEKAWAVAAYLMGPKANMRYIAWCGIEDCHTLARYGNDPFFETHRWNSSSSPAVLKDILERIGGFDRVEHGFDERFDKSIPERLVGPGRHAYLLVTYKDKSEWITCCPAKESGYVEIKPIDFTDKGQLVSLRRA